MARKTQIEKIENALFTHNTGPGITPRGIAHLARVPLKNVYKRIADLRECYNIYSNYRTINGKKKMFYRVVD